MRPTAACVGWLRQRRFQFLAAGCDPAAYLPRWRGALGFARGSPLSSRPSLRASTSFKTFPASPTSSVVSRIRTISRSIGFTSFSEGAACARGAAVGRGAIQLREACGCHGGMERIVPLTCGLLHETCRVRQCLCRRCAEAPRHVGHPVVHQLEICPHARVQ